MALTARRHDVAAQLALTNPQVEQLSDAEFRAVVHLWSWFARYSDDDGEVPRQWLETFAYDSTGSGRPRRITEKMLTRFVERGLVEERLYDDGSETLAIVGWRDFRRFGELRCGAFARRARG